MRYAELYLLEVVAAVRSHWATGWIPLWPLAKDDPGCYLNFRPHGLSYDVLLEELLQLFQKGDVIARDSDCHLDPFQFFVPTRQQVESALLDRHTHFAFCYTLTPQGLARWEGYAFPDWTRYRAAVEGSGPGLPFATTAATLDVAQRWIQYLCEDERLHWDKAMCEIIRPWKISPFKTLDRGIRVVVPTTVLTPDPLAPVADRCEKEKERELLLEAIDPWYRHGLKTWNADRTYRKQFG